jgi:hypothetical protein
MAVILVFAALVIIGDIASVAICSLIERVSEHASLIAFLIFYAGIFVVAWHLAVYITERYLIKKDESKGNQDESKDRRLAARR